MRSVDPLRNPEPLIRRVYAYVAYRIGDRPRPRTSRSETFAAGLGVTAKLVRPYEGRARRVAHRHRALPDRVGAAPHHAAHRRHEPSRPWRSRARLDHPPNLVAAAVASLEARASAELLALRYGADLTAKQIGEALGMKTNAVEVALHRVLARSYVPYSARLGDGGVRVRHVRRYLVHSVCSTAASEGSMRWIGNRTKDWDLETRLRLEKPAPRAEFLQAMAVRVNSRAPRSNFGLRTSSPRS